MLRFRGEVRRRREKTYIWGSVLSVVPASPEGLGTQCPWIRGDDCAPQPPSGSRSCRCQGGDGQAAWPVHPATSRAPALHGERSSSPQGCREGPASSRI